MPDFLKTRRRWASLALSRVEGAPHRSMPPDFGIFDMPVTDPVPGGVHLVFHLSHYSFVEWACELFVSW